VADLSIRPTRCAQVNKLLKAAGRSEVLVRDPSGYFYFAEGDAPLWRASSVATYRISDYTLGEWLDRHAELSGHVWR
jgi:hypothetical protein